MANFGNRPTWGGMTQGPYRGDSADGAEKGARWRHQVSGLRLGWIAGNAAQVPRPITNHHRPAVQAGGPRLSPAYGRQGVPGLPAACPGGIQAV